MWSRWTERGLFQLDWDQPDFVTPSDDDCSADVEALSAKLQSFFASGRADFNSIVLDPVDWTEFTIKIYEHCRRIESGQTRTYKELASAAGNSAASRAVGAAMSRNRVLLVIPCHRVVSANGNLRGFSAPGGLSTKRCLLELERDGKWPTDLFAFGSGG